MRCVSSMCDAGIAMHVSVGPRGSVGYECASVSTCEMHQHELCWERVPMSPACDRSCMAGRPSDSVRCMDVVSSTAIGVDCDWMVDGRVALPAIDG